MLIAIILPVFLVSLSFHEFFRAMVAYVLGDDTAKKLGRLTLNPFAHVDFWGTIMLLFMRVGWASPVQFDLRNFKYPRLYSIISAVAGLISNFMLSLLSFFLLKYVCILHLSVPITRVFQNIFLASAEVNAMLGTFNILPIPPLDGSSVLFAALYKRFPLIAVWLYRYALLILIMLLLIPMTRGVLIQVILDVSNYIGGLFFVDYRVEVGSFFF